MYVLATIFLPTDSVETSTHKRHLLNYFYEVEGTVYHGLLGFIGYLLKNCSKHNDKRLNLLCHWLTVGKAITDRFGDFLLLPADSVKRYGLVAEFFGQEIAALVSKKSICSQTDWQWLQVKRDNNVQVVLLWDATQRILNDAYLDGMPTFFCGGWYRTATVDEWVSIESVFSKRGDLNVHSEPPIVEPVKPRYGHDLIPSIITSFLGFPLKVSLEVLNKVVGDGSFRNVDIYTMMQTEYFVQHQRKLSSGNASEATAELALASICDASETELRRRVYGMFASLAENRFRPTGLATFFPSLSYPTDHPLAQQSRDALGTSCRICRILASEVGRELIVEVVGGSRVLGLYPALSTQDHEQVALAGVLSWRKVVANLVDNLRLVAQRLGDEMPRLAVELEPGPLFGINSTRALKELSQLLADDKLLATRVGLNLDISHYRLSKITPAEIRQAPELADRIWHAHLSGHHHAAHFGDVPPLVMNDESDFIPWLDLLVELKQRGTYSGIVALELEATRSEETLREAITQFQQLLA